MFLFVVEFQVIHCIKIDSLPSIVGVVPVLGDRIIISLLC